MQILDFAPYKRIMWHSVGTIPRYTSILLSQEGVWYHITLPTYFMLQLEGVFLHVIMLAIWAGWRAIFQINNPTPWTTTISQRQIRQREPIVDDHLTSLHKGMVLSQYTTYLAESLCGGSSRKLIAGWWYVLL